MTTFKDVSWSANMKKAYRLACHDVAIRRQNRLFNRNMMIKQKIFGCLVSLVAMALWIWLTTYDTKLIWIGAELFPAMCMGFWLMLTSRNIRKEIAENYGDE